MTIVPRGENVMTDDAMTATTRRRIDGGGRSPSTTAARTGRWRSDAPTAGAGPHDRPPAAPPIRIARVTYPNVARAVYREWPPQIAVTGGFCRLAATTPAAPSPHPTPSLNGKEIP